jgi:hypothetical protein
MAERKYYNANIVYQTDTFGAWVDRTNQLVHDALTINLTAQQNSSGGITTGNVVITSNLYNFDSDTYSTTTGGHLQANVIIANSSLRGGNMTSSGLLSIDSNTNFHTDQITITSNSTQEVITTTGNQLDVRSDLLSVNNTSMRVHANVDVTSTSSNVNINSTATHISGTTLDINSTTVDMDGSFLTADYNDITLTANDQSFKANSTITALDINNDGTSTSTTIAGNTFVVDADETTFSANVTFGSDAADTVSFMSDVDTNIIPSANGTKVLGSTTFRWDLFADDATIDDLAVDNTLQVGGQTDLNGDINLGNANSTISFVGEVDTDIVPSANGTKVLGTTDDRWNLVANDATIADLTVEANALVSGKLSVTGDIVANSDVDIKSEANTNTLRVRTTSVLTGAVTASNTINVAGKSTLASANVTGGLQVNGAVDFNSTGDFAGNVNFQGAITVVDDITANSDVDITGEVNAASAAIVGAAVVGTTLAAGNTTITGFVNATTSIQSGNDLTVGGDADITGEVNAATAAITTSAAIGSNVVISTSSLAIGNSTVNSIITSSSIDTDGTLTVAGNTSLSDGQLLVNSTAVTAVANVDIKADSNTQPNLVVWGDLEVKGQSILASDEALSLNTSTISTLTVTSSTTLRGDLAFINATSFIVDSAVGNSTVGFVPSANGVDLGSSTKRWETYSTTISTSGDVTVSSNTDANSTTGSIRTAGGISAAKKAYIGGAATLANTLNVAGKITGTANTQANSTAGAIKTAGGLSVAKDIYVGGDITDGTNDFRIYYANGTVAWPS